MEDVYYYAVKSKDGVYRCVAEYMSPYMMTGDYLMFDSAEECIEYWASEGLEVQNG